MSLAVMVLQGGITFTMISRAAIDLSDISIHNLKIYYWPDSFKYIVK